ncbi:MAG: FkbM family methyltransferase [Rhodobacteraceae bacterium]|nr:FkbM family methyltransferase [Paracoccaceae bacterium]
MSNLSSCISPLPENATVRLLFLLQNLPGYFGRSFGRKLRRRLTCATDKQFTQMLRKLGPGDLCIDLGANIGTVSERLAATGAQVHAVEPDPDTFATLASRLGHLRNVTLHQLAVGSTSGRLQMFRPQVASDRAGDLASQGVTGFFRPGMSDADNSFEVEQVALDTFIDRLGGKASLVKMDIEGAELDLLEELAAGHLILHCDAIFVETHEKQYPATWPRVRALRQAFRRATSPVVSLYWV